MKEYLINLFNKEFDYFKILNFEIKQDVIIEDVLIEELDPLEIYIYIEGSLSFGKDRSSSFKIIQLNLNKKILCLEITDENLEILNYYNEIKDNIDFNFFYFVDLIQKKKNIKKVSLKEKKRLYEELGEVYLNLSAKEKDFFIDNLVIYLDKIDEQSLKMLKMNFKN